MRKRLPLLAIVVLAAAPRLIHLDALPIGHHAWRQSDTAGVARNFHDQGYRLLYPQVDWEIPGYVEMEFPLYPWVVAQGYRLVGESEVVARLASLLAALATVLLVYLLVRRLLGERAALWAAFFFAVLPMSLFIGRAIMPESWMLAATAAGVYGFLRWTEEESWWWFLLSAAATALACLLKLTSLYLGLPLLWLAWRRYGRETPRQGRLWFYALLVAVPVAAWYAWAYHLGRTYGASFHILTAAGADKWGRWDLLASLDFYRRVVLGHIAGRLLTWPGFALLVVGVLLPRRSSDERLLDAWLLAAGIVLLVASGGSYVHDYYSLPVLLPAVAFMAKTLDRRWEQNRKLLLLALALILLLSGHRYVGVLLDERAFGPDGRPLDEDAAIGRYLAAHTDRGDRVISCNGADPVWLYLARRRGWGRTCGELGKQELESLIADGARVLITRRLEDERAPDPRLGRYLQAFYDDVDGPSPARLIDLTRSADAFETTWRADFEATPESDLPKLGWQIASGRWWLGGDGLNGFHRRRTARAVALPAFAGCGLCRIRATLELARTRGRGREPRASLVGWRADQGTWAAVTLAPRTDTLWFEQREGGERLKSDRIAIPLEPNRSYTLEVRFDLFDFELLVDGRSVLTTRSRFSTTPFGSIALQARAAEVRVRALEALEPKLRR